PRWARRSRGCSARCSRTRAATRKRIFCRVSKALVYALIAALGNVVGALAVTRRASRELALIEHFVAFGAGFMLAVAIVEVLPEGVTISSLMIAVGRSGAQAVGAAALLGVATLVGVLLTDQLGFLVQHGLALSAGVTIYVAASNLVPEFQGKRGWRLPAAFFAGAAVFFVTKTLLDRVS